jgi:hypothetical protein
MQYLFSVIHDSTELATPSEMAAIDAFNDRPAGLPDLSWRGGTVRLRGGWPRTR